MPTPALQSNPTVDKAAQVWTRRFAAAVRDAAGDSGRLTPNKAAAMTGPYADNAQNYFDKTGKSSASVNTVIDSAARYVRAAASAAAGSDGKLSLADIRTLPKDLVDDLLLLRGKPAEGASGGAGTDGLQGLKDAVKAMDVSEISDYGKTFDVSTYPASKSRLDILREVLGDDQLEDKDVRDAFDSTRGNAAPKALADEMRSIGADERTNADDDTAGKALEKKFTDFAAAVEGAFPAGQFKSLELAEHSISEDGDTEHRVLLARQKDDSWLVLAYQDFPF